MSPLFRNPSVIYFELCWPDIRGAARWTRLPTFHAVDDQKQKCSHFDNVEPLGPSAPMSWARVKTEEGALDILVPAVCLDL